MYFNKTRARFHRILSAFTVILALTLTSCINDPDPAESALRVGDRCPDFTITLADGRLFSPEMFRGEGGLIVFFNTGCKDCRAEFPEVQEAYDQLSSLNGIIPTLPGFEFVCIARDQGPEVVADYWAANSLTLPYCATGDRAVYSLFAPRVIPRLYLIDRNLTISRIWTDSDAPSAETLLQAFRSMRTR